MPFGPPHLTLKPSKKKQKTKQNKNKTKTKQKQNKNKTKTKQKQNKNKKTNKEGLGPSEVALRATSHDP